MIRVGVDAWNVPGDRRGIGRYVREILRAWATSCAREVDVTLIVPEWHTWTVRSRYRRELDNRSYRVVSRSLHAGARLDVLWFPFNGCSWTNFSLPAVATLHDATPFVFAQKLGWMQPTFRAAASHCSALITDSVFSQHELARALKIDAARFTPIALGVAEPLPDERRAFDTAPLEPYVLFVGTSDARKGLDVLCAAMERAQVMRPDLRLVLVGERSDHVPGLQRVRHDALGYVSDAALARLYRRAQVFAFPSRYEGFGLPVLEAMTYGAPVVASAIPALREATGTAALLVAPDDASALAMAILRVADDPLAARDLREQGYARAKEMSWQQTAKATLDVLIRAANGRTSISQRASLFATDTSSS